MTVLKILKSSNYSMYTFLRPAVHKTAKKLQISIGIDEPKSC